MSFPGQLVQRCWHLVDAKGQTVGRLANQIAPILRGKHKPTFLPHGDMGDYVVIINAEKVKFTSNKMETKLYRWYTGYPGGLKERPAYRMLERNPTQLLKKAILGMIPRNPLRRSYIEPRLKIYVGPHHPHAAQLSSPDDPTPVPLSRPPPRRRGYFFEGLYADSNTPLKKQKSGDNDDEDDLYIDEEDEDEDEDDDGGYRRK